MAGTCYIEAVRTVTPTGWHHSHITAVRLSGGTIESREDVIRYINLGWIYYTYKPGVSPAKVIVVDCPRCGSGDYITTEGDSTEDNNLLDLPRF